MTALNVFGTVWVGLTYAEFEPGVVVSMELTVDAQSLSRCQLDHEHADFVVCFDIAP